MTEWKKRAPLLAGSVFLLGMAFAISLPGRQAAAQGTPEQRAACEGDASNFCGQFLPDAGPTASCLRKNIRRISPACRAVLTKGRAAKRRARRR